MRPTARHQSGLLKPLNDILGTEASVRLLRALASENMAMTAGDLAKLTRLERSSARRALRVLVDVGVVEVEDNAHTPRYRARKAHPLMDAVAALFRAEKQRAEEVFQGIENAANTLIPPPIAIWIEGSVAAGNDEAGEPTHVRVVHDETNLSKSLRDLRQKLLPLERSHDVTIEVVGSTRVDILARPVDKEDTWPSKLRNARSVAGLPPVAFLPQPEAPTKARNLLTHGALDAHSLAVAGSIADNIKRNPRVIPRALAYLARRIPEASRREQHELQEWVALLENASPARIRRFLVDEGEWATRLRQSSPFVGMMSREERAELLTSVDKTMDEATP